MSKNPVLGGKGGSGSSVGLYMESRSQTICPGNGSGSGISLNCLHVEAFTGSHEPVSGLLKKGA